MSGADRTTNAPTKTVCLGFMEGNISLPCSITAPIAEVTRRSASIDGRVKHVIIGFKQKQVWIEIEQERCLSSTKRLQSKHNARRYHYQPSFLISLRGNYFH